ncbi:MAG: nickel-responsive transcriptional regulator NikR [Sedimentisphaerales bacterium]|nr:nickel-responsive transcriptional regulator NikR [Sedimentisphaerales bacterium]
MSELERIGVSLDKDLLAQFDKLITKQGYRIRSEAIRDLVRKHLSEEQLENPDAKAVAAVVLVYDHHSTKLSDSLIELQHSHTHTPSVQVISSLHVHLDEHDCLEIIILRGQAGQIRKIGDTILSMKGVKLGKINIVAT